MNDRRSPEQRSPLHTHGDASGDRVVPMHVTEDQVILDVVNEPVGVALVGADAPELRALWLSAPDLAWAIGTPGVDTARRRAIGPHPIRGVNRHVVRSGHEVEATLTAVRRC